jgi:tRNA G26 N,N-dimethylase Trm1
MNFSFMKRIIRVMKSFRKFVALLLLLWTPLFFSAAAYAATQMELANVASQETVEASHSCHQMHDEGGNTHQDEKHNTGDSNCQHCGFCVSFVTPLIEVTTNVIPQIPAFAFHAMWVSSTHNITPDHRPPIDA